ncbi:putative nuclease HARBI1 [Homalodisca vitripennis]|uniref:putative nuclease HARBI1 n=1 Tax=Homalodisca vitripennis TaxID=197043 RepID=UPI001EEB055E|nr:putative nuclease HARBI1 [Homalodisca vitripennis]
MAECMPVRARKIYKVRRESREDDYRSLYRFSRESVLWLTDHFLGEDEERRGGALTNVNRMKVFLRYLGDPGFQFGVGEDIGVHRSTVSKTISSVRTAVLNKADVWIKFPTTEEEMEVEKAKWQTNYSFPNSIGAIDCTQIPIVKPFLHGDEYINRKRFASVNVQATCNGLEEFTSVDASWPGSVHDSRIWKNSDVYRVMERNVGESLLIADSGYGIAPWLMTPFSPPATPVQVSFNRCLT